MSRRLVALTLALLLPVALVARAQELPATPDEGRVDLATDKGLQYLAATQLPDGSWPLTGLGPSTGVTSVAVLAFMAKGNIPGQGPYGETVNRGIRYILSQAMDSGLIVARGGTSGPMYNHGMSTLMLSQALGMCDQDLAAQIRPVLSRGIALTLKSQALPRKDPQHTGGWRYNPSSDDADISCTGWQLLSLRAAKDCGADVPKAAIDAAVEYIKRSASPGGGFSYQAGTTVAAYARSNRARAGTGIVSLEICSRHLEPEAVAAANYLVDHAPQFPANDEANLAFYYAAYYCSQAMFQMGDRYWQIERPRMEALLLSIQRPDGSWPSADWTDQGAGPVYCTAMSILSLSVKYHYLPIYQR